MRILHHLRDTGNILCAMPFEGYAITVYMCLLPLSTPRLPSLLHNSRRRCSIFADTAASRYLCAHFVVHLQCQMYFLIAVVSTLALSCCRHRTIGFIYCICTVLIAINFEKGTGTRRTEIVKVKKQPNNSQQLNHFFSPIARRFGVCAFFDDLKQTASMVYHRNIPSYY